MISILLLWLAARLGSRMSEGREALTEALKADFTLVQGATLTLLGLIIGFSYSMATARYDLRKNYEEAEANAIGTEYVRADLLPEPEASQVRTMLRQYTDLRIRWYVTRHADELRQINADTERLQSQLWAGVAGPTNAQPTVGRSLAAAGMNDVLNSQGYTQAAWWNKIPVAAWCLMFGMGLFSNALVGFGVRRSEAKLLMILPLVIALSFFLIADIDSPRGGAIRVRPQNLDALQNSLK
ncbi:bestrophin-like domain [Edaphobacter bradus]|uniref:bestrophin-like domain n=1 Tax=Edaphobacter bradus TaxID=2259016 RepID=UPI0021DFB5F9|nr:hypothetical protein [Edaphobacter bradus]